MIELNEQQKQSLSGGQPVRVREGGQEYVVVRADVYDRLAEEEYDDSPWTAEEMDLLAAEVDEMLDDDLAVEDAAP